MRWMICWNEKGGWGTAHYQNQTEVLSVIAVRLGEEFRERTLEWTFDAQIGDVLEFPLGIVVRTSEQATEIGYDREETG